MPQNTERFSNHVENYIKYRPGYPPEVLQLFRDEMNLQVSSIIAESGTSYTLEFFADGRMNFLTETKVLSITQCRITETTRLAGTFSTAGDTLTMNFSGGQTTGTNSCQSSGNFKKSLLASTHKKTFVVKNLESVFRPDAPLILCLDGAADNACFERLIK